MAKELLETAVSKKLLEQAVSKQLLDGVRVVDFGWVATGPITCKYLSDCGAEVIKIEGRTRLDATRNSMPCKDGIQGVNRGGHFNQWNTGKMSLCLNLTRPKAVEIAKKLVARADVVSENMGTGAMDRMGLGYEALKKVKPDIIYIGSSIQGRTGPAAQSRGFGTILVAICGLTQITGWPDREGTDLQVYTDFINPHYNVLAILGALLYRRRTGKGTYLDTSQHEASLQFMVPLLLDAAVNQRTVFRMGNRSTYAAPHSIYRCRGDDRWCAIAVFTDEEWQSFCRVIGNPAWTRDAKFTTFLARKENEDELDRLVEEWTITYPPEEVMGMMQSAGVAAGVAQTGQDLVDYDPQLAHQHFFWKPDHPEVGRYVVHRSPFIPSKSAYEVRRAPLLGEHNEYILKEYLGMSDEDISELVIDGALE